MDATDAITPYPLAMLLCDHAIVEAGSNKKSLIGIFDRVFSAGFPAVHPLTLYARLTDAEGSYTLKIEYVRLAADEVLVEIETKTSPIADRLGAYELVLQFVVEILEPGSYELRLFAQDTYLGRATFTA